ncbi:MAG: hypothetical protein NT166_26535 [Candidatus Aminicenantes bacterium]|nr:hypothetical protein [Candidatus Aminicenantes bacterium]
MSRILEICTYGSMRDAGNPRNYSTGKVFEERKKQSVKIRVICGPKEDTGQANFYPRRQEVEK